MPTFTEENMVRNVAVVARVLSQWLIKNNMHACTCVCVCVLCACMRACGRVGVHVCMCVCVCARMHM